MALLVALARCGGVPEGADSVDPTQATTDPASAAVLAGAGEGRIDPFVGTHAPLKDSEGVAADGGLQPIAGHDSGCDSATSPPWRLEDVRSVPSSWYQSFGLLFRGRSGRLYNASRQTTAHSGHPASIEWAASTDDGTTWTNATTIFADPVNDLAGYAGGVTPSGAFVLGWWVATSQHQVLGLHLARTTDEGATWREQTLALDYVGTYNGARVAIPYRLTYGPLVVTPEGIALSVSTANGGSPFSALVFSHDDGVTWTDVRPVADTTHPRLPTEEAAYLWVGGTRIVGFCRAAGVTYPTGDAYLSANYVALVSEDMGRTWTFGRTRFAPTPIPAGKTLATWQLVSPHLFASAPGEATLLVTEREYWGGGGAASSLRAVTFDPRAFDPATLSETTLLWSGRFGEFGYPKTAPIAGGVLLEWFSELYPAGPENILFGRLMR